MGPYPVKPKQLMTLTLPAEQDAAGAITLAADVYYPDGEGPFPVLLMRQPYGRAIASTVVYAHPAWYASHGYIVVIQDVRGRGSSGGSFDLFCHEAADGRATVLWAAALPKSTGAVGMYGFSYQGMTQLYAAATGPTPLKTIAPAMVGYDLYHDWAYENGALLLQTGLGWALQLAAETARRAENQTAYHRLYQAAHQLALTDPTPARPQILRELAPESFFHDWLDHPTDDDYWQRLRPDLAAVDLPMLHIGGWFDPYLRGDLRRYQQMVAQSNAPQHLWIGPWGHLPWGRRVGAVDFGPEAENPVDRLQIRWFDHFLKGCDTGLGQEPAVRLFEMGRNRWRSFDHWPEGQVNRFYLGSSGLAGMRQDDGLLTPTPSPPSAPGDDWGTDVMVHDPWRPVPSLGGHAGIPAGSFDRAAIDGRSDVLTYTTWPLTEPLRVAGTPSLELYIQTDTVSFDLSAVLSEVYPDGRVMNLSQGYGRFEAPSDSADHFPSKFTLSLQSTCFVIPAGHALRLSLAAASFPAYAVNSGHGSAAGERHLIEYQIITLAVWHGTRFPSYLKLSLGVA